MGFFDLFGKKPAAGPFVYDLDCSFTPLRLPSHRSGVVELFIRVRNNSDQEQLTSLVSVVPGVLGFEKLGLQHENETRLGMLKPGEERTIKLEVWSNQKTPPGLLKAKIFAISHYRDYAHILNEVRRIIDFRVA